MAATTQNIHETPQAGVLTIGELARTIKRNGVVFWTTLILGLAIGAGISATMTKSFATSTTMFVEGSALNSASGSPDNAVQELSAPGSSFTLETQIELLQSQQIFYRVLNAAGIPIPQTLSQLEALPAITVRQVEKSNVVAVFAEGTDREQVGKIASFYPSVFRDYLNELRIETVQRGLQFVNNRLQEEKANLAAAELEFANFKTANQTVDSQSELQRRINETAQTEERLITAQVRYNETVAAVQRMEAELQRLPKTREIVTTSTDNLSLLKEREKLGDLEVQRETLSQIYTDQAPQVKELDAAIAKRKSVIADLEKSLRTVVEETNPQIREMEAKLVEANAAKDAAQASLAEIRGLADQRSNRLNQLAGVVKDQRAMEQKIGLHQRNIEQLTALSEQFALRDNSLKTGIVSLTPTQFPVQTRPNWLVNMVLAGLLSLALAFVFALARDSMQDRVNSIEEAYALSKLDIMTRIPERPRGRSALISDPQTSIAFESYRVLRSLVGFMSNEQPISSLLITSCGKGEGKTVVASNLAVAFALNGQKVILVDSNFRSPEVHGLFGKPDRPGLGEVLLGQATVEDVLLETPVPGLLVMPAGTVPANATEALGSARMHALIEDLKSRSEMVLFDSAATVGLADTPSLAANVDASILVVQTGKPGKAEFADAVGLLRASSPRVLGLVFNRVKAKNARLENA